MTADDTDLTAEKQCLREDAHGGHVWQGGTVDFWCDGYVGRAGVPQPAERKLIGPAHAHLDAPCTDACYEPAGISDVQRVRGALSRLDDEPSVVAAFERIAMRCAGLALELAATQQMLDVMTAPAEPTFLTHPVTAAGWLFIADYPPAFTKVVADYLAAHDDLDVREIGARMLAANPTDDENGDRR